MRRKEFLQMALLACFGFAVAGLYVLAAEEKGQTGSDPVNAKARRDAAKEVYEGALKQHVALPQDSTADFNSLHDWSVRWLQAERDRAQTKGEQITAVEGHVKRMQFLKEKFDSDAKTGLAHRYSTSAAEFFRLEAEDWLRTARVAGE